MSATVAPGAWMRDEGAGAASDEGSTDPATAPRRLRAVSVPDDASSVRDPGASRSLATSPTPSGSLATSPDAAGGAAGFDAFFGEQAPGILALLLTLTGDRGRAEDLMQDAFVKAYREWGRISSYDKPGAWVRRVAINAAASAGRRRGSEHRALARVWARGQRDHAADVAELADDSAELWALVRALPQQQAAAIALHYLDDAPVVDIAAALGCAEATARVHLHRGRQALARQLGTAAGPGGEVER